MTFGTKLKQARQNAKLSQEQLAEKLCVSRSAVAKWETDKGMPDIQNLKAISQLLDISIDYLLAEDEQISFQTIKEPVNFDDYKPHKLRKSKKDSVVIDKYPDATAIYIMFREKKLTKIEHILEWTVMPTFGLFNFVDQVNNPDSYYLVEKEDKQYLVQVSDEFITSSILTSPITKYKSVIGGNIFRKSKYSLLDK
ncbi:MAG: helix-turn-helix domain-containing protein [Acutalibacteraceae bacterium]|nr:helix-turn-helix domain-containing protein [Acutalibacteraceae bacterium]